ncbi:MAG: hypothetical protein ACPGVY_11965 [Mycobacterium sp.]
MSEVKSSSTCECCGEPIEAPAVQIGDLLFLTRSGVYEMPSGRAPMVHVRCAGNLLDGMVIEVEATQERLAE